MSVIRPDMVGRIPNIGDQVAFNPPNYKGLLLRNILKFSKLGLPIVDMNWDREPGRYPSRIKSIKTEFVIVQSHENKTNEDMGHK